MSLLQILLIAKKWSLISIYELNLFLNKSENENKNLGSKINHKKKKRLTKKN